MLERQAEKKKKKSAIVEKYRTSTNDTGSPEVQVALWTARINHLTEHLKKNKKDFSTQRGLLKLVGARKRFLEFLRGRNPERYMKLIKGLDLRK